MELVEQVIDVRADEQALAILLGEKGGGDEVIEKAQ